MYSITQTGDDPSISPWPICGDPRSEQTIASLFIYLCAFHVSGCEEINFRQFTYSAKQLAMGSLKPSSASGLSAIQLVLSVFLTHVSTYSCLGAASFVPTLSTTREKEPVFPRDASKTFGYSLLSITQAVSPTAIPHTTCPIVGLKHT